jgi:hypothetical protein
MALESDTLKSTLRNINPMTDDVIDAMVGAIENWLKSATIHVEELNVTVDPKTGRGITEETDLEGAIS